MPGLCMEAVILLSGIGGISSSLASFEIGVSTATYCSPECCNTYSPAGRLDAVTALCWGVQVLDDFVKASGSDEKPGYFLGNR